MSTKEGENQAGWNRFRVPFAWEIKVETVTATFQSEGIGNTGPVLPENTLIIEAGDQTRLLQKAEVAKLHSILSKIVVMGNEWVEVGLGNEIRVDQLIPQIPQKQLDILDIVVDIEEEQKLAIKKEKERGLEAEKRLRKEINGPRQNAERAQKGAEAARDATIIIAAEVRTLTGQVKTDADAVERRRVEVEELVAKRVPGEPGPAGADGTVGDDGKSAYQTALDHGFVGSEQEWLNSLKGATGPAGIVDSAEAKGKIVEEVDRKIDQLTRTTKGLIVTSRKKSNKSIGQQLGRVMGRVKKLEEKSPIPGPQGPQGETGVTGAQGPKGDKGEKAKKAWLPGAAIAAALGTIAIIIALNSGDGKTDQAIATPTPSAAAGTPRPTEIPTTTPIPTEVVKTPNFGVRYDPNTEKCVPVDKATGKAVDTSNTLSIERISYQETGVGVTKIISTILKPGQTAITQGWKVDGQGNGVFKAIIAHREMTINSTISDGAVEVVDSQNGPLVFCRAVQIAVDKGYAHEKVEIPEAWKVTQ